MLKKVIQCCFQILKLASRDTGNNLAVVMEHLELILDQKYYNLEPRSKAGNSPLLLRYVECQANLGIQQS